MAKIGYARVSTRDQNPDSQRDALLSAGCDPDHLFTDKVTGKLARRPQWDACLGYLREGDTLVITRLSRAARSLRNLLDVADQLAGRGIDLVVLKQQIDTTTPSGRLVFHIMAAIDEFQRELIVEGTHEGLAAARARGRKGGRKAKLSPDQVSLAREMYDKRDRTVQQIADALGVSRVTVYRHLEREPAAVAR
jgi:DNA invertase Pin-like site-specific DNA recombinase